MVMVRRRKVTLKLIEDVVLRKVCFRKRMKGLLKKMDQLSTLCDVEACAIITGPGDTKPRMWPSRVAAEHLLHKFQTIPKAETCKNVVDQRNYLLEKNKRLEDQLVKLKKKNNDKEMSILMHQIHSGGKSLSDLEPNELKRLLSYVEEKQNVLQKKIILSGEVLPLIPLLPQMSQPLQNEINSSISIDELVSNQPSLLDLAKQANQTSIGFDNNMGSMMGLPPLVDPNGVDTSIPEENFGGFDSTSDLGVSLLASSPSPKNNNGLITQNNQKILTPHFSHLNSQQFPTSNFGGLISENDLGLGVFCPGTFGSLNGESDPLGLMFEGDFQGPNIEENSVLLPGGNFSGTTDERNLGLLHGSLTNIEIGGNDLWPSYGNLGSAIGESDIALSNNNFDGNLNGTYMGIEKNIENQIGTNDNIGSWCNFGTNADGVDTMSFNTNFIGTSYDTNLNWGLPSQGYLASPGEGHDTEVPASFARKFPGNDW